MWRDDNPRAVTIPERKQKLHQDDAVDYIYETLVAPAKHAVTPLACGLLAGLTNDCVSVSLKCVHGEALTIRVQDSCATMICC